MNFKVLIFSFLLLPGALVLATATTTESAIDATSDRSPAAIETSEAVVASHSNKDITTVSVNEVSTVNSLKDVYLGDIADIDTNNEELRQRIYSIKITSPIESSVSEVFSSAQLAALVRKKMSFFEVQSIKFRFPEKTKVKGQKNYFSEKEIVYGLKQRFQKLYKGAEIELADLKIPVIQEPAEILSYEYDFNSVSRPGVFAIALLVDSSRGKTSYAITGKVKLISDAPVAQKSLMINDRITRQDYQVEKVEIANLNDQPADVSQLKNVVLASAVQKGQAILTRHLKKTPVISKGQIVKVLIGESAFEVSTQGSAEENGFMGERIRIKISDTQKVLTGSVESAQTVRVE